MWANAKLGSAGLLTSVSSKAVNTDDNLCFNFWFDLTVRERFKCDITN